MGGNYGAGTVAGGSLEQPTGITYESLRPQERRNGKKNPKGIELSWHSYLGIWSTVVLGRFRGISCCAFGKRPITLSSITRLLDSYLPLSITPYQ
jgi:hypothetical protein